MSVFNDITSPFKKPWDLSLKADQECWLVGSTASSNHVRFNVLVATPTTFLELVQCKSKYYCWGPLMSVPIESDGTFDKNVFKLTSGEEVTKVTLALVSTCSLSGPKYPLMPVSAWPNGSMVMTRCSLMLFLVTKTSARLYASTVPAVTTLASSIVTSVECFLGQHRHNR